MGEEYACPNMPAIVGRTISDFVLHMSDTARGRRYSKNLPGKGATYLSSVLLEKHVPSCEACTEKYLEFINYLRSIAKADEDVDEGLLERIAAAEEWVKGN